MKHQAHFGTKSAIVSREAAQIRILIDDLARTVDVLDAGVAADLPRADGAKLPAPGSVPPGSPNFSGCRLASWYLSMSPAVERIAPEPASPSASHSFRRRGGTG